MLVLRNIGSLAACGPDGGQGSLHEVPDAALAWKGGVIEWVGPEHDLPRAWRNAESFDAGGRLVIPGLVDCHTHLGFAGWRADEFEARLRGASYEETLRRGGASSPRWRPPAPPRRRISWAARPPCSTT